jgi:selenoprotein W-related protein
VVDLLKEFENEIESLTLVPAVGGRFEVKANNRLLYSKLQTGRHADQGEVAGLLRKYLKESP